MLADPMFGTSAAVDVLLRADVVFTVLTGQVVPLGSDLPVAVGIKIFFYYWALPSPPSVALCLIH